MPTIFRYGSRDSLPLKQDTTSGIDRIMVTNVDENGDLVSSGGGGSGTEYTAGATPPATPVGGTLIFDDSGTWQNVTDTDGLPVTIVSGSSSGTEYTEGVDTVAGGEGTLVLADNGSGVGISLQMAGTDLLVSLGGESVTVDGSGVTQPVSAASLPLPTGASTSALQTSGNALLTTIDADTSTLAAVDFATQTTLASLLTELGLKADLTETQPVSAASLPLPSGAATEATLSTIDADTSTIAGAVSGTEMQVDVLTSALPAGAATESTLANLEIALDTATRLYEGVTYTVAAALLNATSTGNTQLVAAGGSSTKHVVLAAFIVNTGASAHTVNFQSSTTAITPNIEAAPDGGGGRYPIQFECAENEALNFNLSGAGTVGVHVNYITVAT